jgi:hypothetical protein
MFGISQKLLILFVNAWVLKRWKVILCLPKICLYPGRPLNPMLITFEIPQNL